MDESIIMLENIISQDECLSKKEKIIQKIKKFYYQYIYGEKLWNH
jgi:hypothetical protein